jgi:hypothetical protein
MAAFALTPASAITGFIDFTTSEGQKLYNALHISWMKITMTANQEHPDFFLILEIFKRHKRQTATERDKCTLLI